MSELQKHYDINIINIIDSTLSPHTHAHIPYTSLTCDASIHTLSHFGIISNVHFEGGYKSKIITIWHFDIIFNVLWGCTYAQHYDILALLHHWIMTQMMIFLLMLSNPCMHFCIFALGRWDVWSHKALKTFLHYCIFTLFVYIMTSLHYIIFAFCHCCVMTLCLFYIISNVHLWGC